MMKLWNYGSIPSSATAIVCQIIENIQSGHFYPACQMKKVAGLKFCLQETVT